MSPDSSFLQDGGEMGAHIRAFDWPTHPLGPPETWPQALRTSIRLMLTTRHPVFIFWGRELYCFYNDAYSQSLGPEKHPVMLGARGRDMWPEIEGVGRGSTFTVRLPLPLAPRRTGVLASSQDVDHVRPEARRVLVVDDNRDSAESLALLLGLDGHNIRRAHGGEEALAVAAEFRPEIVLLDIGMPGMNGYEVARRLRAEAWASATTLVALTGWGQAEDKRRASEAGFDHHLVKPVDLDALARLFAPADSA